MSNPRRSISFQNNKAKQNKLPDTIKSSDRNELYSRNGDFLFTNKTETDSFLKFYPGSLSRKSVSAAVLNELQSNSLYRKQQLKLDPRKSSSVEFIDSVSVLRNDKKKFNQSFDSRENRRSTSLSELFKNRVSFKI